MTTVRKEGLEASRGPLGAASKPQNPHISADYGFTDSQANGDDSRRLWAKCGHGELTRRDVGLRCL